MGEERLQRAGNCLTCDFRWAKDARSIGRRGNGWRQEELSRNAVEVSRLGKELFDRIVKWMEHLETMGDSLDKTVKAFNSAMSSFESRIVPTARKLSELGTGNTDLIQTPDLVEVMVRQAAPLE